MKIVLDTNIILSGLVFPKSLPGKILNLARTKKIQAYLSCFILEEIKKNLIAKFHYKEDVAQKFIDEILKFAIIIQPKNKVKTIKEKNDDNRILECAQEARAQYLITGDKKHILPLKEFQGTKIVTAREFMG